MDIFSHYSRTYCSSCCRTKIADRLISKPFQVKTRKSMSPFFVELLFMTHGPRDANDYTHGQSKFDFTIHICYSKIAAEFTLYRWTFKNIKTRKYKFSKKKSNPNQHSSGYMWALLIISTIFLCALVSIRIHEIFVDWRKFFRIAR